MSDMCRHTGSKMEALEAVLGPNHNVDSVGTCRMTRIRGHLTDPRFEWLDLARAQEAAEAPRF